MSNNMVFVVVLFLERYVVCVLSGIILLVFLFTLMPSCLGYI